MCKYIYFFRAAVVFFSPLDQDLLRRAVLDERLEDESHRTAIPSYPRREFPVAPRALRMQ